MDAYTADGWLADDAVMRALAAVEAADRRGRGRHGDPAVYRAVARDRRRATPEGDRPGAAPTTRCAPIDEWPVGTASCSSDGLRFDIARRLRGPAAGGDGGLCRCSADRPADDHLHREACRFARGRCPGPRHGPRPGAARGWRGPGRGRASEAPHREGLSGARTARPATPPGGRGPSTAISTSSATTRREPADAPRLARSEKRRAARRPAPHGAAGSRSSSSPTMAGSTCPAASRRSELPSARDGRPRKGRAARLADGAAARGPDGALVLGRRCAHRRRAGDLAASSPARSTSTAGVSPQECVTPVIIGPRGRRPRTDRVGGLAGAVCGRASPRDRRARRSARSTSVARPGIRRPASSPGAGPSMATARQLPRGGRRPRGHVAPSSSSSTRRARPRAGARSTIGGDD